MTTNIKYFPEKPYHDNFDENDNYMRILFRPGYSVQVRELNQLQTAIQAQIDRFGQSIFKQNARVIGGDVSLNNQVPYVNIENEYGNFNLYGENGKTG